jgi:hypothetical protein
MNQELMQDYSQWFFNGMGWFYVTGLGAYLGWNFGLKSYILILPLVLIAILGGTR